MFTCNPVSGDPSMVAINASWGLGLAVVGGEVTPDDYLVSKVTGEVVREQHQRQDGPVRARAPAAAAPTRIDVAAPSAATSRAWIDDALAALVDLARRVERHFGSHQDVEWAIARAGRAVRRPVAPGHRRSPSATSPRPRRRRRSRWS